MSWIKKSVTRVIGITIIVFIFLLFSIYLNLLNNQFKKYFEEQSKQALIKDCKYISTEIEMFMQKYTVIIDQAKNNPDFIKISREIKNREQKKQNPLYDKVTGELRSIAKMDKNISLAYIGLQQANDLITDIYGYEPRPDYDLDKRDWYTKTVKEGKTNITYPYVDLVTGRLAVTIAAPLIDDNECVGAVGLDLMIDDISTVMHNYKIGENGYATLVYKDGRVLYHPDYKDADFIKGVRINELLGDLSKEILSSKGGIASYTHKGREKFISYLPIGDTGLIVCTVIPKSEVFSQLNKFIKTNLVILIALVALTIVFLIFLNRFIASPVVRISKEIENYTNFKDYIALPAKFMCRQDEIGILSRGLTDMLQQLSRYVLEIEEKNQELTVAKEKINAERSLFKTTIHSLGDGVISTDRCGNIKIMNNVAESLTGWSALDARGQKFGDVFNIVHELTGEKCENPIKNVLREGKIFQLEENTLLIQKTGKTIPIEDSAAPIKDESGSITGAVIVFRDFTDKKQKQEQIIFLSYHDQLTGLYNRRFFEEKLKQLDVEDNIPISMAMVDVNGLKLTNDAFGHKAGDALLIKVASILKNECRADDIVARVGGDEFIMLLPKTTNDEAQKIVKRIYKAVSREKFNNIVISISIGFDTKSCKEKTIDSVLMKAEEYMYRKKITESQSMRNQTIQVIFKTLQEKNEREKIHSERVSEISKKLVKR